MQMNDNIVQAEDGDFVGPKTDPFIGQAVFPVDSIRPGTNFTVVTRMK